MDEVERPIITVTSPEPLDVRKYCYVCVDDISPADAVLTIGSTGSVSSVALCAAHVEEVAAAAGMWLNEEDDDA